MTQEAVQEVQAEKAPRPDRTFSEGEPAGWSAGMQIKSYLVNDDFSITVEVLIGATDPKGRMFTAIRKIRLNREPEPKAAKEAPAPTSPSDQGAAS